MEQLQRDLGRVEGKVEAQGERLDNVETKIDSLGDKLDSILRFQEQQRGGMRVLLGASTAMGAIAGLAVSWFKHS